MASETLQKLRRSYQNSTLNEWKLKKMPDGQLRIVIARGKQEVTLAIVNRLEDAVFIESAHRFLPGIMGSIDDTEKRVKKVTTDHQEKVHHEATVEPKPPKPKRVVQSDVKMEATVPGFQIPEAGKIEELA